MVKSKYYNHMPEAYSKERNFYMLNVIEVTKKYGKTLACDNVSFQVDRRQYNSASRSKRRRKSTIIKCDNRISAALTAR